jgi:hypothetical protein
MASDFDLLSFVGVEDERMPHSGAEREADERRRKQHFDEMQFQAHIEQERRRRERAEQNLSGKCHRFPMRDMKHHYGNFWFAEGTIPTTHDIVGRAAPPPADRPIAHTIDGASPSPPPASSPASRAAAAALSPRAARISQAQREYRGAAAVGGPSAADHYHYVEHGAPRQYEAQRDEPVVVLRSRTPPPSPAAVAARCAGGNSGAANSMRQGAVSPSTPTSRSRGYFNPVGGNSSAVSAPGAIPSNVTHAAPYASHYNTGDTLLAQPPRAHPDRDGILRGVGGRDEAEAAARAAQRLADDMRQRAEHDIKKLRQEELKRDLDAALSMKRHIRAEEKRAEDHQIYGVTLPIRTMDPRSRIEHQRVQRAELERTWAMQEELHRCRQEAERARTEPDRGMWWLDTERRERESAAERQAAAKDPKDSWRRAWQEHQITAGELDRARARDAAFREENELSVNVANYADRIILAEQQRKAAQQAFRHQLDEQVKERQTNRRSLIAENYPREKRFSRGPFDQYPSTYM